LHKAFRECKAESGIVLVAVDAEQAYLFAVKENIGLFYLNLAETAPVKKVVGRGRNFDVIELRRHG
jgi:hypothetical protein